MSFRTTRQFAQLWQLPLLLLSLLLFAVAGYLFVNASPGLTVRKRIEIARLYVSHERPEAALEQLNRLLTGERLAQENEATVHLLIGEALEAAQKQRKISIAANYNRILEQTQIALAMGVAATGEIHRRLGDSYQALGKPADAISHYNHAINLEPARALRFRKKIIEVQAAQEDSAGAMASLNDYLLQKDLTSAERGWALGEKSEILADRGDFVGARALITDALHLDSDPMSQAQANYRMAYCAWKLGKTDEAERLAQLARDQFHGQHPLDADAAYLLARLQQEKGDLPAALKLYVTVVENFPECLLASSARLGEAVCLISTGQEERGLGRFRELGNVLLTQAPQNAVRAEALKRLREASSLLAGKMHYQSALDVLELERSLANPKELPADYFARLASAAQSRALEIEQWAGASNPSEKIRRSQQVAELLLKAGEAELAHSRLLAQSRDATYVQAFWSALDLLNRAGNKRAATDAMELLVAEHSDDAIVPEVLLRLGQSYQDAAQPEKAIAAYRQLQTKYSSSASAARSAVLLAQAQIARGPAGYAAAQDVLTQFLHSNMSGKAGSPEHRRAALELGQLLYRMDRFEEAIASLTEQVEAFPNGERAAEAMFTAADSYRKSALKIEAKVASSQATSGSTELTQAVANKKQRLATARTMYDRLVEFYSKARPSADVQKQQERLSHFYRADCAFELANYEEAIKLYDAAAARYEQEPAALAAYVQIVNSYCALGKMEEARTANEKAKLLLRRLPAEAFNDGGFTMPKDYWEQWLKWTTTAGAW